MKLYTRKEIKAITGIGHTTLERWYKELRDTHMVNRENGTKFTDDFVHFITNRMGKQGPGSLPSTLRIAALYRLKDMPLPEIAEILQDSVITIEAQMRTLKLEIKNG